MITLLITKYPPFSWEQQIYRLVKLPTQGIGNLEVFSTSKTPGSIPQNKDGNGVHIGG